MTLLTTTLRLSALGSDHSVLLETSQRKFIISQSGSPFRLQLSSFSYLFWYFTMCRTYKVILLCVKGQSMCHFNVM